MPELDSEEKMKEDGKDGGHDPVNDSRGKTEPDLLNPSRNTVLQERWV